MTYLALRKTSLENLGSSEIFTYKGKVLFLYRITFFNKNCDLIEFLIEVLYMFFKRAVPIVVLRGGGGVGWSRPEAFLCPGLGSNLLFVNLEGRGW